MNNWKSVSAGLMAVALLAGSLAGFAACGKKTDPAGDDPTETGTERETTRYGEFLPEDAVETWDVSAASDGSLVADGFIALEDLED